MKRGEQIVHPFRLFALDSCFYFFDFCLEGLVHFNQVLDGLASVQHGSMVALSNQLTDLGCGIFRVLLGEEHGNLAYLDDFAFAGLGMDS